MNYQPQHHSNMTSIIVDQTPRSFVNASILLTDLADWDSIWRAVVCVSIILCTLYWGCGKPRVMTALRYSRQLAIQLCVLFYVTLVFYPLPDNTGPEYLDSVNDPSYFNTSPNGLPCLMHTSGRREKQKYKMTQTDGRLHKRIAKKINRQLCMWTVNNRATYDKHMKLQHMVSNYNRKEQALLRTAAAIQDDLASARNTKRVTEREIIFLQNWVTILTEKVDMYQKNNQHLVNAFKNLGTQIRIVEHH